MKYFTIVAIFFLFTGCSHKDAFTNFKMTEDEKILVSNTQSSKIEFHSNVQGILSAIYLNNVNQKLQQNQEKFVVSVYLKDRSKNFTFLLNDKKAIKIQKLSKENRYAQFMSTQREWSDYYLVTFKGESKELHFSMQEEEGRVNVASLIYQKY